MSQTPPSDVVTIAQIDVTSRARVYRQFRWNLLLTAGLGWLDPSILIFLIFERLPGSVQNLSSCNNTVKKR